MSEKGVWLKTPEEKLTSLIADEAKNHDMILSLLSLIRQMQAKSNFRLALLNQLLENELDKKN